MNVTGSSELTYAPRGIPKTVCWSVIGSLTLLEFLALGIVVVPIGDWDDAAVTWFVRTMARLVPMIGRFNACSAQPNGGVGLMLALSFAFLPVKLLLLMLTYPGNTTIGERGWRAAWGFFYAFLIAMVALVFPFYVWGWVYSPAEAGLPSINRKTAALCRGGWGAFYVGQLLGGFILLALFVGLSILRGLVIGVRLRLQRPRS